MKGLLAFPVLLIFLLSGCEFTPEAAIEVPIEIGGDESTKLEFAKNVIQTITPGLKQRISSRFSTVTSQELDTLMFGWGTSTPIGSGSTTVFIQIKLQYKGTIDEASAILQFCEGEVKAAIRKLSQSPA